MITLICKKILLLPFEKLHVYQINFYTHTDFKCRCDTPIKMSYNNTVDLFFNIATSLEQKQEVLDKRRNDIWSNGTHHRCSLPSTCNKWRPAS